MEVADAAPIRIERVEVTVYRAPVQRPVVNAFGGMTSRPAVIVELTDRDGATGLGEVWCNFPACGAEHRARLIATLFAPLLRERPFASPAEAFRHLSERTHRLALQSGEAGPFAQAIAGLDTALHDLVARRAGLPLWQTLRLREGGAHVAEGDSASQRTGAHVAEGDSASQKTGAHVAEGDSATETSGSASMRAYASGINPDGALEQALAAREAGFRAFKLKVGFGREVDLANLRALRDGLGPEARIAVDANQAWDLGEAEWMSAAVAEPGAFWLEEPLAVDRPDEEWLRLAAASPVPLAGGENLRGEAAFAHATGLGALRVLQPDLAKWGGFTGCMGVVRAVRRAGRTYCPHYLGGGIGLLASAHLLAAAGGDGMLEVDSNPNPLREGLAAPFPALEDGRFVLGTAPGLGVAPSPEVERFAVLHLTA